MSNSQGPVKGFRPLPGVPSSSTPPNQNLDHDKPTFPIPTPSGSAQTPTSSQTFTPISSIATPQSNIVCPSCRTLNQAGNLFCLNCGTTLTTSSPSSQTQAVLCTKCGNPVEPGAQFCIACGEKISWPDQHSTNASYAYRPVTTTQFRPGPITGAATGLPSAIPWLIVAIIGAALALISFFLPLAGVTLTIPESFFSNSMEIKVSFSAWQLLSNSAPNVEGAGWLGEMSQDLYEEYDMTNMVADSFGDSAVAMIKIARFIVFLLGVLALAVTGLSVWSYSKKQASYTQFKMGIGIAAILLLLIATSTMGASIETGSVEGNALVNALVNFWNGFGFWGMLFGFAAFSFANFKQR